MKNQVIIAVIITAIAVGIAGFYGGFLYQKSKSNLGFSGRFSSPAGRFRFAGGTAGPNNSIVRGTILSNDGKTMTVKLPNGSSKIIVLAPQTNVTEATQAAQTSLQTGKIVTIFGTSNPDGSVTADNVAIGGNFRRGPMMGQ